MFANTSSDNADTKQENTGSTTSTTIEYSVEYSVSLDLGSNARVAISASLTPFSTAFGSITMDPTGIKVNSKTILTMASLVDMSFTAGAQMKLTSTVNMEMDAGAVMKLNSVGALNALATGPINLSGAKAQLNGLSMNQIIAPMVLIGG